MLKKHSIIIAGHASSVSLEPPFWEELSRIAEREGVSLNHLVSRIDQQRDGNLSSALRLFVLADLQGRLIPASP